VTRSLKPIPNHFIRNTLEKFVADHPEFEGMDGELIVGFPNLETTYNTTNSAVMRHDGEPEFVFYAFDLVRESVGAAERSVRLKAQFEFLEDAPQWLYFLPQKLIANQDELEAYYNQALDQGYEGVMLKLPDGPYKFGRASAKEQYLLKVKPFADSEATILEVYEAMHNGNEAFTNELGHTERSSHQENKTGLGMIGGFVVKDPNFAEPFKVSAGTLTHEERRALWPQASQLVGKLLKYRYLNKGIKNVPRHGRFIGWRSPLDM
jgi:DNA ligase-1